MPTAIALNQLAKSYGKTTVLHEIDLTVRTGEIFGFLGPNGAGKTTTIRCMLDLIRPSSGSIEILGLNPQTHSVEVRKKTGYLPGELHLEDSLSADAILHQLAGLRGEQMDWSFVDQLCQRLDLDRTQTMKNFSKGNKQKVGIIQALMHRPAVLLLDEPTSGLDPLMQQEVMKLIREAQQKGATVFFSSHNLNEIQAIADRVGIIRGGHIVEVAATSTLLQRGLRKVRLTLGQPTDLKKLIDLDRVTLLHSEGKQALFQVEGEMRDFLQALSDYPVLDLQTQQASLEDIFLTYYQEKTP